MMLQKFLLPILLLLLAVVITLLLYERFGESDGFVIDTAGIRMKKGALATVDLHTKLGDGEGELRWLVPPDLLAGD